MDTLGARLRAERERLGLNQPEFAALAGQSKQSQIRYEAGDRSPDGDYLSAVAGAGADVLYILTGERQAGASRQQLAADYERQLDELEDRLERHAVGLTDMEMAESESVHQQLVALATSKTPQIASTYRERADDILRNHFSDENAAKRRQRRFSERNRLVERASRQLEDMVAALPLHLPANVEREFLTLMLNYKINPNDLFPIFAEMRKAEEEERKSAEEAKRSRAMLEPNR